MLALTLNIGERLIIGDDVMIEVDPPRLDGRVRLAVHAPKDVAVDRESVRRDKVRCGQLPPPRFWCNGDDTKGAKR